MQGLIVSDNSEHVKVFGVLEIFNKNENDFVNFVSPEWETLNGCIMRTEK